MKQGRVRTTLVVLLSLFFINTLWGKPYKPIECALVDTIERDRFLYKPFIEILESVGFAVTYKPLDLVIDQDSAHLALHRYKAVFFILGTEFLGGLARQSHFCQKVLQLLDQYACRPGVTVGLVFPSMRFDPRINIVSSCAPIFDRLGVKTPFGALRFPKTSGLTEQEKHVCAVESFFYMANVFLTTPLESRPMEYHTTLNMPHPGIQFDSAQINNVLKKAEQPLCLLPLNQACSQPVKMTLPYGLYWFNQVRRNHVFVTTTTLLTFAGISESFQVCPVSFAVRQEMLSLVQRMMMELALLAQSKDAQAAMHLMPVAARTPTPTLPKSLKTVPVKKNNEKFGSRKTAWMEISIFEDCSINRALEQDRLIDYIFSSGLDDLWITFNPHLYYSPIGRLAAQDKEQNFIASLALFTKKLADYGQQHNLALPGILIGYEITNNLYEPNMPKRFAVDLYENKYPDLPEPLDRHFWKQEVVKPLQIFLKKFKDPAVSHGVKLSGVVLDLEMYCRKKTGSFLTPMGFEGHTFDKFAERMKLPWAKTSLRDRILLLMNHKLGRAYFRFLEQEAQALGDYLKNNFNGSIKDCEIMCYLPNLQTCWFYKGLIKGLATKKAPVHLLTFNSDFFSHQEWFAANCIPVTHASVLLLSKLQDESDFAWVDFFLANHHGVWLNRFSRFVEPKSNSWTSVEQPGMQEELYEKFMEYLHDQ